VTVNVVVPLFPKGSVAVMVAVSWLIPAASPVSL
jgi:hypothetical protein